MIPTLNQQIQLPTTLTITSLKLIIIKIITISHFMADQEEGVTIEVVRTFLVTITLPLIRIFIKSVISGVMQS
jgi:hypothetical protein